MLGVVQPLQLIFGIHRTTHRIGLYIQKNAPELTQAEAHILCHVYESGDAPLADLHRAFAHKRSTLTSVLDRLDARGFVTRVSSPQDRRSFIIRLTGAGRKEAAKIHRILEAVEAAVLRDTNRTSVEAFDQVLARLEQRLTRT